MHEISKSAGSLESSEYWHGIPLDNRSLSHRQVHARELFGRPNSAELRERLGIADPVQLIGYAESFEQLAAFDGSKTGLIIWQVEQDYIDEIAERKPAAKQRIILVWRPFDQYLAGYKEKRLRCYPSGFSASTPEEEWLAALRYVRATDSGIVLKHFAKGITVVDASDGYPRQ